MDKENIHNEQSQHRRTQRIEDSDSTASHDGVIRATEMLRRMNMEADGGHSGGRRRSSGEDSGLCLEETQTSYRDEGTVSGVEYYNRADNMII